MDVRTYSFNTNQFLLNHPSVQTIRGRMKEAVLFPERFTAIEVYLCLKYDKTDCVRPSFKAIDQPNHPRFKAVAMLLICLGSIESCSRIRLCWDKKMC